MARTVTYEVDPIANAVKTRWYLDGVPLGEEDGLTHVYALPDNEDYIIRVSGVNTENSEGPLSDPVVDQVMELPDKPIGLRRVALAFTS